MVTSRTATSRLNSHWRPSVGPSVALRNSRSFLILRGGARQIGSPLLVREVGFLHTLFLYALKESTMCTSPLERDGNTFACRACDACIATRRHQWVCRAMMEKALWPHTLCLTLSYNNDTQSNRDAAAMFQYADVRAFLDRVRKAVKAKQDDGRIRFLVAGEQGERNGRCHWHCIIYSSVDLTTLGTVHGLLRYVDVTRRVRGWTAQMLAKKVLMTDKRDMLTKGKNKKRLDWSLWGHGFVCFQEPDQGGMNYVLSYSLKDQFTPQSAKGTMREGKVENFATGLFRMSKRPAIGEQWLYQTLERLDNTGSVLPALKLKVPGVKGTYQPSGTFRKKLLWALVALNQRVVWSRGQNAPQWPSLVASLAEMETDQEILNGTETNDQKWDRIVNDLVAEGDAASAVTTCGAVLPCNNCLRFLTDETLSSLGLFRYIDESQVVQYGTYDTSRHIPHEQSIAGKGVNPFCQKAQTDIHRAAFDASKRGDDRAGM